MLFSIEITVALSSPFDTDARGFTLLEIGIPFFYDIDVGVNAGNQIGGISDICR